MLEPNMSSTIYIFSVHRRRHRRTRALHHQHTHEHITISIGSSCHRSKRFSYSGELRKCHSMDSRDTITLRCKSCRRTIRSRPLQFPSFPLSLSRFISLFFSLSISTPVSIYLCLSLYPHRYPPLDPFSISCSCLCLGASLVVVIKYKMYLLLQVLKSWQRLLQRIFPTCVRCRQCRQ